MAKSTDTKKTDAKEKSKETEPIDLTGDMQTSMNGDFIQLTKAEFEKVRQHIEEIRKEKDGALASEKKLKKQLDQASEQISELQTERDEAIEIAQRLRADFDNYRKRNASLRTDSLEEGRQDCMQALLPVLDNFDRAIENAVGVEPGFLEGVQLVQRLLLDTLGKMNLEEISANGKFDANLHYAVMQEATPGRESGEILEVLQKGYRAGEKILRYSMVKVAE